MNPIRTATGAIIHPVRTAGFVAGASLGVVTTGLRTTARVVGWAVERAAGPRAEPSDPWPTDSAVAGRAGAGEPGDVVDTEAAVAEAAASTAPTSTAPARRAPATKATAKRAAKKAPARKAPARKAPAKKSARRAPSKKAAVVAPALGLTESEAEDVLRTPSGIPAAGDGHNPDTTETDLHQPGTEPIMDPGTVKAAASESAMMRRAADRHKG